MDQSTGKTHDAAAGAIIGTFIGDTGEIHRGAEGS
jgi:hypothetical protein